MSDNENNSKVTYHSRNDTQSEYVTEIISSKPGFLIHYGSTIFLLTLLLSTIILWFIKYPDVINASAILSSINAPKPIIAQEKGKLTSLTVKENDLVEMGEIIGSIESIANRHVVLATEKKLLTLNKLLASKGIGSLASILNDNNLYLSNNQLGELQLYHQEFSNASLIYKNYFANGFYLKKRKMLGTDISNLLKQKQHLLLQQQLYQQDLKLSQQTFDANESLKNDKIISEVDFRNESSKLISKKMSLPQIASSLTENEGQLINQQKEILELDNTIAQQKQIYYQALNTYLNHINVWKKKYLLIAPIEGKVSFTSFLQLNQSVEIGEKICYINPVNSSWYAEVTIRQSNFGKATVGQTVLLKFPSYPFREYGAIKGKINFIAHIPSDSGYKVKVLLNEGLTTTYNKRIQYYEGLTANAEIITTDLRLLQRFYYNVVNKISN